MADVIIPIGRTNFVKLRETGSYYIDKTKVISALVKSGADSILFTRPRRFGKTTLQSMLYTFFDIRRDSKKLFEGLEIMREPSIVEQWMNKYPVIFLSLKEIDGSSIDSALGMLHTILAALFKEYSFLLEDELFSDERNSFLSLMQKTPSIQDIKDSLRLLASLLHRHYEKRTIILIDEYDVPLDKAFNNGYYNEMLELVRSIFYSVLKDNDDVEKSILTGCLRVSKESLFTGLNNLKVYSVTNDTFSDVFGFTEKEVVKLLIDTGFEDKLEVIRKWYDGYHIGKSEIYTPWDVLQYVAELQGDPKAKPEDYWANASGNDNVIKLIEMTEATISEDYSTLIEGGTINKNITESLTYNTIYSSEENVWSLLLATGYLTLAEPYDITKQAVLRLPNEELRHLFASCVDIWFSKHIAKENRSDLFTAIWKKNPEKLSSIISDFLFETISYYDYREDYYHAFLAGLFSGAGYIVKSNRESGTGRPDIILMDKKNHQAAVFEIKRADSRENLSSIALKAAQQIADRKYGEDLSGYKSIVSYGVSFFEKEACVAFLG